MTARAPNELCTAFAKHLKALGWCKISVEKYNAMRPYNRFDDNVASTDRIGDLLSPWLKANGHEVDDEEFGKVCRYAMKTLTTVSGKVFMPKQPAMYTHPESKNCYVNTYRTFKPKTERMNDIEPFLTHLAEMWPEAEDYAHCVGWLAHSIQRPEERPSWHLLLTSEAGTGKGFLVNSIMHPLLLHTSTVRSYGNLTGKFSTLLEGNLLVLLDDPATARPGTMTQLKSILSEDRAFVEHKHANGVMVPTYTRFILASNEFNPVGHDEDERRWYVPKRMTHAVSPQDTQRRIQRLADWLRDDATALDRIFNWFMAYELKDFNPKHVKQSATLLEMIGASKDPLDDFYAAFVAENKVFHQCDLVQAIKAGGYVRPTDSAIATTLTALGFVRKQFKIGGKRSAYYCLKGTTQAQAEAHLAAETVF